MRTKVRKLTSILLAVIMVFSLFTIAPITASAVSSEDFWYRGFEDGTATIIQYKGSAEVLEIPSELDGYTVTSIHDYAFVEYTSLQSVIIPDSVTSIGEGAFRDCTNLTSVTIPDSVTSIVKYLFYGCTNLTSVTIPDSVTSIGKDAFEDCTSLKSITIPNSVTSIYDNVFTNCTSLTEINVDGNNPNYCDIDGVVFNKDKTSLLICPGGKIGDVVIPDSVTSIGNSAFSFCESLKSVTIPDSVTSIGNWAFHYCTSLESVTISENATSLGDSIFRGCESLKSITIPDSVTSIDECAFDHCTGLTSVTLGNGVTSIGNFAFSGCTSLTAINVDGNNPNYCEIDGVVFNKDKTALVICPAGKTEAVIPDSVKSIGNTAFSECKNLKGITIPDGVTRIGEFAFFNCANLTSVTIPDSVTSMEWYVFSECYNLTSVTIGNGVTYIEMCSFSSCTNLKSITIPDSVTGIGGVAFDDCTSLTSVTIPDSVTSVGNGAFEDCTSLTSVTIPDSVTEIGYQAFGYRWDGEISEDVKVDGFTIYGYSGTSAETYATEHGFEFVSLGNAVKDDKTDISVTIKNQAELSVEKLTDTESINKANVALKDNGNLIALYDISLIKDGAPVQPDGTATVKIPSDNENAKVYRIEDDGTATDMNAVYSGGYMVFTTEHFSTYALVVPNDVIIGDANGDGEVNVLDVSTIQLYVAKMTAPEIVTEACDVDGDGDINVNDVSLLQMKIAKLIP